MDDPDLGVGAVLIPQAVVQSTTGPTSISSSTLAAPAANFDITSIPSQFNLLLIYADLRGDTAANQVAAQLRFNNDSAANYDWIRVFGSSAGSSASNTPGDTLIQVGEVPAASGTAGRSGPVLIQIYNYSGTTFNKSLISLNGRQHQTAAAGLNVTETYGNWRSTAAINRITLLPAAGNWDTGSRITIWGVA